MSDNQLPLRASLENLRKQAKALHRAFDGGDADAIARIREHLPRADALSNDDVPGFDLSLQEAQHVLGKEYGLASWDELRALLDAPFDAIADLPRSDLQEVLRHTDQRDWVRALSMMPEHVREAVFSCMSRRVARTIADEILGIEVTAPEAETAQQVILGRTRQLAIEKGFPWPPTPPSATFEDLARLTDQDTQKILREMSMPDLTRAVIGAPDAVRGRLLGNMSQRVRTFILEESERLAPDLPPHELGASRQRVVEWASALGRDARIQWPPPADRPSWSGELPDPMTATPDPLQGRSFEELSIDELAQIYGELTVKVKREGIQSLSGCGGYPGPIDEGLRLAVDGTDPDFVRDLVGTRAQTMVRNRRQRLMMMRDGIGSLQAGDNPHIIYRKMQARFLDPDVWAPPTRSQEDIVGAVLRDWIEREWLTTRTPADIAELFLHLGFTARNAGLEALAPAAQAVDHPLLRYALEALAGGDRTQSLLDRLSEMIDVEVSALEIRLRAIGAGILGVIAGSGAEEVADAMRNAAATESN